VYETWPLTPRNEQRLAVFENKVLRRLDPRVMKLKEAGENGIMRSFIICTPHQILL
jgi:hypothetical protein